MKCLHIRRKDLQEEVELSGSRVNIGRDPSNHVVLSSPGVSRFHASIINDDEEFYIVDLGSTNGVYVNGKRISGRCYLKLWDVIKIDEYTLEIVDPSLQRPTVVSRALEPEHVDSGVLPKEEIRASGERTVVEPGPLAEEEIPAREEKPAEEESPTVVGLEAVSEEEETRQEVVSISGGPKLVAVNWKGVGPRIIELSGKILRVGRAEVNDVVLDDPSISLHQAEIVVRGEGEYWVRNLSPLGNTYLNGDEISEARLSPGDTLGFHSFVYQVVDLSGRMKGAGERAKEPGDTAVVPGVSVSDFSPEATRMVADEKPTVEVSQPQEQVTQAVSVDPGEIVEKTIPKARIKAEKKVKSKKVKSKEERPALEEEEAARVVGIVFNKYKLFLPGVGLVLLGQVVGIGGAVVGIYAGGLILMGIAALLGYLLAVLGAGMLILAASVALDIPKSRPLAYVKETIVPLFLNVGLLFPLILSIGFALFVIPGIYLFLRLWPVPVLAVIDGRMDAVPVAWRLTKGNISRCGWPLVWEIFIWTLPAVVASLIISVAARYWGLSLFSFELMLAIRLLAALYSIFIANVVIASYTVYYYQKLVEVGEAL